MRWGLLLIFFTTTAALANPFDGLLRRASALLAMTGNDKIHYAELISAHDGDTVRVLDHGQVHNIRLLGLDTPEIDQAPWGSRAREALCAALNSCRKGTKLSYEYDVQRKDKYKRDLAYVYNARGEMLNELLLKSGYAVVLILEPNTRYATKLKNAEVYARSRELAIWQPGKSGLEQSPYEFRKRKFKTERKRSSR